MSKTGALEALGRLLGVAVCMATIACGGTSGDSIREGVFVDSPVEGLRFEAPGREGFTDAEGTFLYDSGDTVSFFVGDIPIGSVRGAREISILDIFPDALSDDRRVINLAVFLQSLDADGDPEDGIDLTQVVTAPDDADLIDFDRPTEDFREDSGFLDLIDAQPYAITLVSTSAARSHLLDSLSPPESDYFRNRFVGRFQYVVFDRDGGRGEHFPMTISQLDLVDIVMDWSAGWGSVEAILPLEQEGGECLFTWGYWWTANRFTTSSSCIGLQAGSAGPSSSSIKYARLDRIVGGQRFAPSDFEGVWGFGAGAPVGSWDQGTILITPQAVAAAGIAFGADGAFTATSNLFGEASCSMTGYMNATKTFAGGVISCSGSAPTYWNLYDDSEDRWWDTR